MRLTTLQISVYLVFLILASSFAGLLIAKASAPPQKLDENAAGVIRSWNAAVETIEPEDQNFRDLQASYKHDPPGAGLVLGDVRAAQKKRRLELINSIIASHEERLRNLRNLAKYEDATP